MNGILFYLFWRKDELGKIPIRRHNQVSAKQKFGEELWEKKWQLWDKALHGSLNWWTRDEALLKEPLRDS
jgi:hypothetical protein